MKDPVTGLTEMARVTRRDGVVAACVWDYGGAKGPLRLFWGDARALAPDVDDESDLPGTRAGHLAELFGAARLREIEATALSVRLEHPTFDTWREPFTRGVGPAGAYLASLDAARGAELREQCRRRVPSAPFVVTAVAWAARGLAQREVRGRLCQCTAPAPTSGSTCSTGCGRPTTSTRPTPSRSRARPRTAPAPDGEPPAHAVDPADDYLMALAAVERAVLVSGDAHLTVLADRFPVQTPAQFLAYLGA